MGRQVYDTARVLEAAMDALLWIVPPEAIFRIVNSPQHRHIARKVLQDFGVNLEHVYFREQKHGSLPVFVQSELFQVSGDGDGGDDVRRQDHEDMIRLMIAMRMNAA
jgi:hypothetical protein